MRGDLIRSLNDLLIKKRKRFDYVIIETTGLADPSPVAHTFMASELAEHWGAVSLIVLDTMMGYV